MRRIETSLKIKPGTGDPYILNVVDSASTQVLLFNGDNRYTFGSSTFTPTYPDINIFGHFSNATWHKSMYFGNDIEKHTSNINVGQLRLGKDCEIDFYADYGGPGEYNYGGVISANYTSGLLTVRGGVGGTHLQAGFGNVGTYIDVNGQMSIGTLTTDVYTKLLIKGLNPLSAGTSTYSFKTVDQHNIPTFSVKEDGIVQINSSDTGAQLVIATSASPAFRNGINVSAAASNGIGVYASGNYGVQGFGSTTYGRGVYGLISNATGSGVVGQGGASAIQSIGQTSDSTTYSFVAADSSFTPMLIIRNDGRTGIGTILPSAKLHIKGVANNSTTDSIYVENSGGTNTFTVRDDGYIRAGKSSTDTLLIGTDISTDMSIAFSTIVGTSIAPSLTGTYNTFFGSSIGNSANSAARNTAMGAAAMASLDSGFGNIGIGFGGGQGISNNSYEIAIGYKTLETTHSGVNIAIGGASGSFDGALSSLTNGDNIAIGNAAGALMDVADGNTLVGMKSMARNTNGNRNTTLGSSSGEFVKGSANDNVYIGYLAGYFNNELGTGDGLSGGSKNVIIGSQAAALYTGSSSVIIGYNTAFNAIQGNNQLIIDNDNNSIPLIYGDFISRYVGLGTTQPTQKLEVNGNIKYNIRVDGATTYSAATEGGSTTVSCSDSILVLETDSGSGAGILAFSVTLCSTPVDGQQITIVSAGYPITVLTVIVNPGQSLVNGGDNISVSANNSVTYQWRDSNSTWYIIQK